MRINKEDAEHVMQELDRTCWQCQSSGKYGNADCNICYGTGYQPTRAGVELLNFLRRQKKRIERERV